MWKKCIVIILLASVFAGLVMYYLHLRRESPEAIFTTYGPEIFTTTASSNQISTILHEVASEISDSVDREDGKKHIPSFHQGAKGWNDDEGNLIARRSTIEFDNKNGNHCVIEDISITGKPRIILLKSDTKGSTMELANELLHQFHKFKISSKR